MYLMVQLIAQIENWASFSTPVRRIHVIDACKANCFDSEAVNRGQVQQSWSMCSQIGPTLLGINFWRYTGKHIFEFSTTVLHWKLIVNGDSEKWKMYTVNYILAISRMTRIFVDRKKQRYLRYASFTSELEPYLTHTRGTLEKLNLTCFRIVQDDVKLQRTDKPRLKWHKCKAQFFVQTSKRFISTLLAASWQKWI